MSAVGALIASSAIAKPLSSMTGPPNQPPPRPYGPTRSTASARRWTSSSSHSVKATRLAVSSVPDMSTTPVVDGGTVVDTTAGWPESPEFPESDPQPVDRTARTVRTAVARRPMDMCPPGIMRPPPLMPWSASMQAGWSRTRRCRPRVAAISRCRRVPPGTSHGWRSPSGRSTRSRRQEPPGSGWRRPR